MKECKVLTQLRKDYPVADKSKDVRTISTIMLLINLAEKREDELRRKMTDEEMNEIVVRCKEQSEAAYASTELEVFNAAAKVYAKYVL